MSSSPKIELIAPFVDATKETFKTLAAMDLRRRAIYIKDGFEMYGEVSGVIGLSGTTTGTCSLSLQASLAEDMVRAMLMMPENEELPESDIRDGIGELINMIAGAAKTKLSTTRYKFNITLPTIISGGKHEIFHRNSTHCVVVVFENAQGKSLALEVCVAGL